MFINGLPVWYNGTGDAYIWYKTFAGAKWVITQGYPDDNSPVLSFTGASEWPFSLGNPTATNWSNEVKIRQTSLSPSYLTDIGNVGGSYQNDIPRFALYDHSHPLPTIQQLDTDSRYVKLSSNVFTYDPSVSSIDTTYGNNIATGIFSSSLGGNCNLASGVYANIIGGLGNYNPLRDSVIGGGVANHTGGFAPFGITAAASISGNGSQTRLTGTGIQSCFSSPFTSNNVSIYYSTTATPLSAGLFTTATIAATGTNYVIINGDYSTCTASGLSACSIYVYDRAINNTGYNNFIGGGKLNTASGCYGFIGGGICNITTNSGAIAGGIGNCNTGFGGSFIGGGNINCITATPGYAFIAGGRQNSVSGWYSAIGGGSFNNITGQNAVVAGGASNAIISSGGSIGGGCLNRVTGLLSNIGGGVCNAICGGTHSTIVGGKFNYNPLFNSSIVGGSFNHTGGYTPANITAAASISGNGTNTALILNGIGSCFSASGTTGAVSLMWMTSGTANSTLSSACFATANVVTNAANCIIINGDYSTCRTGASACSIWVYDRCVNNNGCTSFIGGGVLNTASGCYGVLNGGYYNTNSGCYGFLGGGRTNRITSTNADHVIVGGGQNQITTTGSSGFIGGGIQNTITGSSNRITIAGGSGNSASGAYSFIGGGATNRVANTFAVVAGGANNCSSGSGAGIVSGRYNTASGTYSFVAAGSGNNVAGTYSSIAGGVGNCINSGGGGNFIGGGCCNSTSFSCSVVVGGQCNCAGGVDVVVGGFCNTASANYSVVVGGAKNNALNNYSFIAGGQCNHTNGFANTFILGSSLSATKANYTYVNNLSVQGNIESNTNYVTTLSLTANQTANNAADTVVTLDPINDPNNWFNRSTRRITPTIPGYYHVDYQVAWVGGTSGSGNQNNIQIRRNGTSVALAQQPINSSNVNTTQNTSGISYLNGTTDYLEFTAYSSNAAQSIVGTSDGAWTKVEVFKIN
ncbi:hypothetical protein EBZ39_08660 [bacterium]|nr:hypothetical protein [bacterium]